MEPIRPVSAPSAGGSKNALAACVATKYLRMRCASAACSPGVATSSRLRMEPTGWEFYSKQELPGILTVCSYLTSGYQLSNDHWRAGRVFLLTKKTASCIVNALSTNGALCSIEPDIRVWPSGKAADFGSAIPRFESWHPSYFSACEARLYAFPMPA